MATPTRPFIELVQAADLDAIRAALAARPELLAEPEPSLGWPPLTWAIYHGCNGRGRRLEPVVELLLAYHDGVDLPTAALLDRPDLATAALARGEAVDGRDGEGRTALHLAADRGSVAVAALLLDHGADPDARTTDGRTALAFAAHPGPLKPTAAADVVDLLRARGATVDLPTAAMLGDLAAMGELLAEDPTCLDAVDAGGATALFHAAHDLRLAAVDFLLRHGADVDHALPYGQTPLSTAVDHAWDEGGPELVARLLAADPTIDLCTAAQLGMTERAEELLASGVSLEDAGRGGYSCLFLAAGAGDSDTVAALLRAGAAPDEPDPYHGATALHNAAAWGRREVCEALLTAGADPAARNGAGQTPGEVARGRGREDLADWLERQAT